MIPDGPDFASPGIHSESNLQGQSPLPTHTGQVEKTGSKCFLLEATEIWGSAELLHKLIYPQTQFYTLFKMQTYLKPHLFVLLCVPASFTWTHAHAHTCIRASTNKVQIFKINIEEMAQEP